MNLKVITVGPQTEVDVNKFCDLAEHFMDLNFIYQNVELQRERVPEILEVFKQDTNLYLCLLEDNDSYVGMVMGSAISNPFVSAVTLSYWWVHEDYKGRVSLDMFKQFEDWAYSTQPDVIHVGCTAGDDRLHNYFLRKGYQPYEQVYAKLNN